MEYIYILVFLSSLAVAGLFIRAYMSTGGIAKGTDINKKEKPLIPESGGLAAAFAIVFLFILFSWLGVIKANVNTAAWLALSCTFAAIGVLDDRKQKFAGLPMPWIARAIPIAFVSLAFSSMLLEGIIPIVLGALFIAGLASFHNTFAGLNGWEVGTSFLISVFTSSLLYGTPYFALSLIVCGAILALLAFNKFPARIFPGDSGTLLFGSSIAGLILLGGGLELAAFALLFYIPHMIDFFALKLYTGRGDVSQCEQKPYSLEDGKISIPSYKGGTRYDFAKFLVKIFGPMEEWRIVAIIWFIVAANSLFWILAIRGA